MSIRALVASTAPKKSVGVNRMSIPAANALLKMGGMANTPTLKTRHSSSLGSPINKNSLHTLALMHTIFLIIDLRAVYPPVCVVHVRGVDDSV